VGAGARHQNGPHQSLLLPHASLLGGKWFPIRPGTDGALAIAIMYVWIAEDRYDQEYVATRTTGFEEWRDYVLGTTDGVAKTPEWQEAETGIPARDVRALAREVGKPQDLSVGGNGRHRPWRRVPGCDRRAVGALDDTADGDARMGKTGNQHG